ncbi:MAG: hypothetical protein H8F28_07290 [Fibrella sp.]|nr:hypothetical protein [Armatimonadota bacterium]
MNNQTNRMEFASQPPHEGECNTCPVTQEESLRRYEDALIRTEKTRHENVEAADALIRAQSALSYMDPDGSPSTGDPLDDAAGDLQYYRRAYCDALRTYRTAEDMLNRVRYAFRSAQERVDTLALRDAVTRKSSGRGGMTMGT